MSCHGLNCTSKELIKAHIIPAGFGRFIRGTDANVKMTPKRVGVATPQLGEFDPDILCETCDRFLGRDDEYALSICERFEADHRKLDQGIFELPGVDCERFCKFVLSVLWRASISRRRSFSAIDLGPYEDRARDVLFGPTPLSSLRAYEVIIQRYRSDHMDTTKWYFQPARQPFGELNAYGFGLAGFRIVAKLDNRPFHEGYRPLVLNRSGVFFGLYVRLEDCSEFESMAMMVRNNAGRKSPFRRSPST
ncbi:hypothetical protein ACVIGA_002280 [Bradyrhizobium sp. USDA 3240]